MSAPYAPRRTDAGSRFRSVVNEASDVELCRHFLFYGGFAVTAGWILWQIHNNITQGRSGLAAIPIGYGVALIGMGLFFLSGVGDQIWHAMFGIERNLEAFLSPTHLLLVIGMALLVSAPFRDMWSDPRPRSTSFLSLLRRSGRSG